MVGRLCSILEMRFEVRRYLCDLTKRFGKQLDMVQVSLIRQFDSICYLTGSSLGLAFDVLVTWFCNGRPCQGGVQASDWIRTNLAIQGWVVCWLYCQAASDFVHEKYQLVLCSWKWNLGFTVGAWEALSGDFDGYFWKRETRYFLPAPDPGLRNWLLTYLG